MHVSIHDLCTTQNKHSRIDMTLKSLKKKYISLCRLKSVEINSLTKISSYHKFLPPQKQKFRASFDFHFKNASPYN